MRARQTSRKSPSSRRLSESLAKIEYSANTQLSEVSSKVIQVAWVNVLGGGASKGAPRSFGADEI